AASFAVSVARLPRRNGVSHLALSLAYAAGAVGAVAKVRHVQLRDGYAHQVPPLAADHFAMAHVLPQILADLAPHDLPEAVLVAFDLDRHDGPFIAHGAASPPGLQPAALSASQATRPSPAPVR